MFCCMDVLINSRKHHAKPQLAGRAIVDIKEGGFCRQTKLNIISMKRSSKMEMPRFLSCIMGHLQESLSLMFKFVLTVEERFCLSGGASVAPSAKAFS